MHVHNMDHLIDLIQFEFDQIRAIFNIALILASSFTQH